ncbi:MAG: helix-turn-helix transcriptional regulator [Olsenella uli]|uniref:helix-turn-helix domain-containing protein n=1 Tax=Olsenella uli TaxID=133926 RepID=UPI001DE62E6C|nr:helix-turn-helix transcriptional regulator [Olsenella uli]MBS6418847.1 helix-turn-helix transcriptional regulator [Olsenella uli]
MTGMRRIRFLAEKSLRQVARETGIPYRTLQNWEAGGIPKAPLDKAVRVARSLGCEVSELLPGE